MDRRRHVCASQEPEMMFLSFSAKKLYPNIPSQITVPI
jgi:hypothetical protein